MVDTGNGIKSFVVKFFQREQEDLRHSVVNEVLGNVLAREFDLPCPTAALIELSEEFQLTLNRDQQKFMDSRDSRIKFGCDLIDDVNLFTHSLRKSSISKKLSIENLFAFDVLIRNHDRSSSKPNLLVGNSSAYLIDHELGFDLSAQALELMAKGEFERKYAEHHIFLPYLRKANRAAKKQYFDAFEFYLQSVNFGVLSPYFKQLKDEGYETDKERILEYLNAAKANCVNFVTNLKGTTL